MTTENDKQLRQLLRKSKQLPEPDWNLIARATKKWSSARAAMPRTENPSVLTEVKKEQDKKPDKKQDKEAKLLAQKNKKAAKEIKDFKKDIQRQEKRVAMLKRPSEKKRKLEATLETMKENFKSFYGR